MVIPSIKEEEEVEVEEDGNGLVKDLQKNENGGLGRGFSHGNGREIRGEISQMHNVSNQQNRQEHKWSVPASTERREDNTLRRESQRAPPTSSHSKDRLFTD